MYSSDKEVVDFRFNAKPEKGNEWLMTYLDVFILLLAFFLILVSKSDEIDIIFEPDGSGFRSITQGQEPVLTPIWDLKFDLEQDLATEIENGLVHIQPHLNEIRLEFTDGQFYRSGSSILLEEGKLILNRIIQSLSELKYYQYHMDVEGHTDDQPINTFRFPSNWELSTARASNIIRYLIEQGFPPNKLKASGYADTQPVASNRDAFGNPIPENMALNRRIVIRIFYESNNIQI